SSPTSPDTVNPMPMDSQARTPSASTAAQDQNTMSSDQVAANTGSDVQAQTPVNADVAARLGIPVENITNGPVPDTPENRANYGRTDSRAGRMTNPLGN